LEENENIFASGAGQASDRFARQAVCKALLHARDRSHGKNFSRYAERPALHACRLVERGANSFGNELIVR
jgi:hypothetical protein